MILLTNLWSLKMTTNFIDFFDLSTNNNEPLRTDEEFGLCDDRINQPAYSDNQQQNKDDTWIAVVENVNQRPIQFFALDHRIPKPQGQRICDGMLQVNGFDELHLVELKEVRKSWCGNAKEQLAQTIIFMAQHHQAELGQFRHKYAHACNKKHPNFNKATASDKAEFRQEADFILKTKRIIEI